MTRRSDHSTSSTGVIHVSLGWTLWLLAAQPREGMRRFVRFPLLWMALGTVLLAGMVQGSLAAVNLGSLLQLAPLLGLRMQPSSNALILTGTALAVGVWLAVAALNSVVAWLLEHPVPWRAALTTVGMSYLPWAAQGLILPLALAGKPRDFLIVSLVTAVAAASWSAFLQLVALETMMGVSQRLAFAGFLLVVGTLLLSLELIGVAAGLSVVVRTLGAMY